MSSENATPDDSNSADWAKKATQFIRSLWYVLATLLAFLTFLNAAFPQIVGDLGTIGGGIGSAFRALYDRPTFLRSADASSGLPSPENINTASADGYAYYEVSKTGQLTDDGKLLPLPQPPSLPDFDQLKAGQILQATDEVYLRSTGNPTAQPLGIISAEGCVQVVQGQKFPRPVQVARSGGYLPVRRVSCP